jgi:ribose transport system permease protein
VGSVFGFAGVFSGFLMLSGFPVWLAIIMTLCAAALVGCINGFFVVKFHVNSLMMTLGTMILVRGALDGFVRKLGGVTYPSGYRAIARFKFFNIHFSIMLMIITVIILEYLLFKHIAFKKIYYIGENLQSAKIYGIKAEKIKLMNFIVCGVTAGLAGVLAASRSGQTVFNTGVGLEFKMVTAAVLGGASLFGGKGSILKSVFGLIFLSLILNGMVMYNVDPEWQAVVVGIILISAVVMDTRINRDKVEY